MVSPRFAELMCHLKFEGPEAAVETGDHISQFKDYQAVQLCLAQPLVPVRPSDDWIRPTHITEGNMSYSVHQIKYSYHSKTHSQKYQE